MSKPAKRPAGRSRHSARSAAKLASRTARSKVTKQITAQSGLAIADAKSVQHTARELKADKSKSGSKQSRVLAMLSSPQGARNYFGNDASHGLAAALSARLFGRRGPQAP